MTPEETVAAGRVMISGGPWDSKCRYNSKSTWNPCDKAPYWDWHNYEYRKRPETQYVWINVYPDEEDGSGRTCTFFLSRTEADAAATSSRVGRIKVQIEERFDE